MPELIYEVSEAAVEGWALSQNISTKLTRELLWEAAHPPSGVDSLLPLYAGYVPLLLLSPHYRALPHDSLLE